MHHDAHAVHHTSECAARLHPLASTRHESRHLWDAHRLLHVVAGACMGVALAGGHYVAVSWIVVATATLQWWCTLRYKVRWPLGVPWCVCIRYRKTVLVTFVCCCVELVQRFLCHAANRVAAAAESVLVVWAVFWAGAHVVAQGTHDAEQPSATWWTLVGCSLALGVLCCVASCAWSTLHPTPARRPICRRH